MSKSRSKVHPSYKTKYKVRNLAEYDRALARRGDLTIWFSPEALASWEPKARGSAEAGSATQIWSSRRRLSSGSSSTRRGDKLRDCSPLSLR